MVFALGDVHGHLDRLEALLKRAGIIGECPTCMGQGDILPIKVDLPKIAVLDMCPNCQGDGIARISNDVTVVQLGDLGHFGQENRTGDELCYHYSYKHNWVDIVLWGNHDRAVIDNGHAFRGFMPPSSTTKNIISALMSENRYRLAYEAHGFLLTHAGLHKAFYYNDVDDELKHDPAAFADWINEAIDPEIGDKNQMGVRDAIGMHRGGGSRYGGILWRDVREKLYMPFRQVFGHSADSEHMIRYCWEKNNSRHKKDVEIWKRAHGQDPSYCIDIGGREGSHLAGIWLPSEEIVTI